MKLYLYDIERNFYKSFFDLMSNDKKNTFLQILNWLEEEYSVEEVEQFREHPELILSDLYGYSIEQWIFEMIHYELDIYLETVIDNDNFGILNAKNLIIWKYFRKTWVFHWIQLQYDENTGWYNYNMIVDSVVCKWDFSFNILKEKFDNRIIYNIQCLLEDILIYDKNFYSYISTTIEFSELNVHDRDYKKEIFIPIQNTNRYLYINNTISPEMLNLKIN
jgi:hypothetical protein